MAPWCPSRRNSDFRVPFVPTDPVAKATSCETTRGNQQLGVELEVRKQQRDSPLPVGLLGPLEFVRYLCAASFGEVDTYGCYCICLEEQQTGLSRPLVFNSGLAFTSPAISLPAWIGQQKAPNLFVYDYNGPNQNVTKAPGARGVAAQVFFWSSVNFTRPIWLLRVLPA